ncbi:hypothetical protein T439DRAFT_326121 [Meredithblackwellia eburnea MCA 4105]
MASPANPSSSSTSPPKSTPALPTPTPGLDNGEEPVSISNGGGGQTIRNISNTANNTNNTATANKGVPGYTIRKVKPVTPATSTVLSTTISAPSPTGPFNPNNPPMTLLGLVTPSSTAPNASAPPASTPPPPTTTTTTTTTTLVPSSTSPSPVQQSPTFSLTSNPTPSPTPVGPPPSQQVQSQGQVGSIYPALHLTPLNDTFVPKQISLAPAGARVKIGRQTNAKSIPNGANGYFDSKVLSRMHAEVWSDGDKVFIKDVKSSNGTFINGQRLSAEAAESDTFELHTGDLVEFGIDIIGDDGKNIVHHKVAAKCYCVMNQDDATRSERELQIWFRQSQEQPVVQRRGAKVPGGAGTNGLSFEHVLTRLQGELTKSRDTNTHLNDLNATLNEVQDTLSGGAPPPLPNFPPPRGQPYGLPPGAGQKDVHAQSIAALQSQLNETQSSLANHVGKIRDLEGLLAEHEVIKREVGSLRKQMEDAQRDMEAMVRERAATGSPTSTSKDVTTGRSSSDEAVRNGRESPIASLLEAQEAADDFLEDDDDARSIASVETVRLSTKEQVEKMQRAVKRSVGGVEANGDAGHDHKLPNGVPSTTSGEDEKEKSRKKEEEQQQKAIAAAASAKAAQVEKLLHEQNSQLTSRLDALAVQLEAATALGITLREQHSTASTTIAALEKKIEGLEKAVENRAAEVEGKAEERWNACRKAFEESWKKEREGWEVEREKLLGVVREWEERKKAEAEADGSEGSDWEPSDGAESAGGGADAASSGLAGSGTSGSKGLKSKRPRSRRRRRSTATRVSTLAADSTSAGGVASDSDSTIGGGDSAKTGPAGGAWNGPQRGVQSSGGAGNSRDGGGASRVGGVSPQSIVSAGAMVILGVATAYVIANKMREP